MPELLGSWLSPTQGIGPLLFLPEGPEDAVKDYRWSVLREERNRLLGSCDWTQLPDSPVDKVAWENYRQELRDLPDTIKDILEDVIFPTPPEG